MLSSGERAINITEFYSCINCLHCYFCRAPVYLPPTTNNTISQLVSNITSYLEVGHLFRYFDRTVPSVVLCTVCHDLCEARHRYRTCDTFFEHMNRQILSHMTTKEIRDYMGTFYKIDKECARKMGKLLRDTPGDSCFYSYGRYCESDYEHESFFKLDRLSFPYYERYKFATSPRGQWIALCKQNEITDLANQVDTHVVDSSYVYDSDQEDPYDGYWGTYEDEDEEPYFSDG